MQKILPIAIPPIIGYLHHAYPLSILAHWTTYLPWLQPLHPTLLSTQSHGQQARQNGEI